MLKTPNKITTRSGLIALVLLSTAFNMKGMAQEADPITSYLVNGKAVPNWELSIGNGLKWHIPVTNQQAHTPRKNLQVTQGKKQIDGDAIKVKWKGRKVKNEWGGNILNDSSLTLSKHQIDISSVKDQVAIAFDFKLLKAPNENVTISMQCNYSNECSQKFTIKPILRRIKLDEWSTLAIPLKCFKSNEPFDYSKITSIMSLSTQGKLTLEIANIGLVLSPKDNVLC